MSKSRWESRKTARSLDAIKLDYRIVVEPQEHDQYAAVIDPKKILVLPFSNLGQGSIPARNWIWEHSISVGAKRFWQLDDNILHFYRLNNNKKTAVTNGAIFRAAEDFVDRYENVALAGFNYQWLAKATDKVPPFYLNTRIYSCILIDNTIPFRFRGRYNEDTALSLDVMKAGLCTVLFNAFLCGKTSTMTMKGGNTDELYQDDGRLKMAQSLREQHPDVVRVVKKFKRWQHHVDYRPFKKNKLILRADAVVSNNANEYGMVLRDLQKTKSAKAGQS